MTRRLQDAREILHALGLPPRQCNERSAYTLLALAGMRKAGSWSGATAPVLRIVDIMEWMKAQYGKEYAPNSRETIRRETIHQFEQARLIDKNPGQPDRPTNSGKTAYQLTGRALAVLKAYGSDAFPAVAGVFMKDHGTLSKEYASAGKKHKVAVKLPNGKGVHLSPGQHNELQRLIVEEFAARFVKQPILLYLGDSEKKHAVVEKKRLAELQVKVTEHDKLPDVIILDSEQNWLFLIEAVTSHGPVSPKRHKELEVMFSSCPLPRVYVTAFLTAGEFRRFAADIVWESEVWIAEAPGHMIHYNGDKFLGPSKTH